MSPAFEILIRIGGAAAVFTAMALWEWRLPRRHLTAGRRPRWPANLGIPGARYRGGAALGPDQRAVGVALLASARGWGLFHLLGLRSRLRRCWLSRARPGDLCAARHVPCRAGAVAAAPHAPRRPRHRRDHRRALPPVRDPALLGDQVAGWWCSARRRWPCWSSRCCSTPPRCSTTATCACRPGSTGSAAGCW